jgi:hypothetical protein
MDGPYCSCSQEVYVNGCVLCLISSNTIIIPDAGALPAVSHSRRPEKSINGYSITFPWCPLFDKICQPWQLERSPKLLPLRASPKLDPVNLEDSFAAAKAVPGNDRILYSPYSPENKVTVYEHSIGSFPPPNAIFQKYTYSEAWKLNPNGM